MAVAREGGPVIAYRAEVSPSPLPSPAPSASSTPAPKADKTKDPGAALTIRDLVAGTRVVANDVSDYAVSDDDRFVAYATETKSGTNDGLHLYDVARKRTVDVLTGAGRYRRPAFARDGTSLAFLSDVATYAADVPHDALYVVDLRAEQPVARKAVDSGTPGLAADRTPNANGAVTFARDGARVFLGTAAAPTPMPANTPAPMGVDLWSWHDDVLQSVQKHDADAERKRTYLGVYDLGARRFAQLGAPELREVARNENGAVALGFETARTAVPPRGSARTMPISTRSRSPTARGVRSRAVSRAARRSRPAGAMRSRGTSARATGSRSTPPTAAA